MEKHAAAHESLAQRFEEAKTQVHERISGVEAAHTELRAEHEAHVSLTRAALAKDLRDMFQKIGDQACYN